MSHSLDSVIELYKNFTKNFVEIEKLLDVLDTTPEIVGYDT